MDCLLNEIVIKIICIETFVSDFLITFKNLSIQDISHIIEDISHFVGMCAAVLAYNQYRESQKWKRLEYATSILSKINTDPDLILAKTFLDWRERDISVPERFLGNPTEKKWFIHTHRRMAIAFDLGNREILDEHDDLDLKVDHLHLVNFVYVEIFDSFLSYLEQINHFLDKKLIKIEEITLIKYLVERIFSLKVNEKLVFEPYLKHYRYNNVHALYNKYIKTSKYALFRSRLIPSSLGKPDE